MKKDKLSVEVNLKKITLDLKKDAIVLDLDIYGFIGKKQVYHEKQTVKQFMHEDKKERSERSKIWKR
jgi:hypothetical protein